MNRISTVRGPEADLSWSSFRIERRLTPHLNRLKYRGDPYHDHGEGASSFFHFRGET